MCAHGPSRDFKRKFTQICAGLGHASRVEAPPQDDARPYGRRTFLAVVAGGLTSLVWGPPVWKVGRDLLLPLTPMMPPPIADAIRSGWRIYTVGSTPSFEPATWRLRVDGLVERPLDLRFREVRALPRTKQVSDFHCVTGWSVDDVRWTGVRMRDLLDIVRPKAKARAVGFYSGDGVYSDSLTLDQVRLSDVLLAYELDGAPLSAGHGAPLRLVIPQMYGYKSVKWVERITLLDAPFDGYWQQRGYDRNAWID
jgi:DMSO/TMAO reductase YedYZ molybdopterin-dependent catalytic subunit